MAYAKKSGGGIMFSGKHKGAAGGDGSPMPPDKTPSGKTISKAPGLKETPMGPSVSSSESVGKYRG
jgi:hypothetical protein